MKRFVALTLVGLCLISLLSFFPLNAQYRDVEGCYSSWGRCRNLAFRTNVGVIRTTLLLTICDVALGYCIVHG